MNERAQRIVFLCIIFFILGMQLKSHGTLPVEASMAFVRYTGTRSMVTVRIQGDVVQPGIYKFSDGEFLMTVTKMAVSGIVAEKDIHDLMHQRIPNGSVIHISRDTQNYLQISLHPMKIYDTVLLGVPLHPDRLTAADWEYLPGIGPALAQEIIKDRHKNGAFGCIESVQRVPGVGNKKIFGLIKYF